MTVTNTAALNGLYTDADGQIRYYVDGEATYAGLVYCNGYYYYINSSKTAVRDRSYFPTYTNGLIEVSNANTYYFDELGRLKQGLYVDSDGETRYYETGVQSYAGLVYWNGYYYYFNSSKTAVKNCSYWVTNTNGLMASASYTFDSQGRMVNPPSSVATMSIDEGTETYVAPASATAITTTEEHEYFYAGGKLLREEVTTTAGTSTNTYTIDFIYDQSGRPYAFMYGNVYYYYITNLQGDVMSIVDEDGNVVASYEYDPYGNVIEAAGILAEINPLRYRGYVYNGETDFYYCQSRYYDPQIGRFINADTYASTGQGIVGNNMFAYCNNNPARFKDSFGSEPTEAVDSDGDGEVDYYRYEYTYVYFKVIHDQVYCELRTGCAYIFPDIGHRSDLDYSDAPIGFNPDNDILICYYVDTQNGHDNPVLYAYQAQRINVGAYDGVIEAMLQYDADFNLGMGRTRESLLTEWNAHMLLFGRLGLERTANVDFDRDAEGMTTKDYIKLAVNEFVEWCLR